ncbi:MAG TPA: M23 family metallopeptidase [Acidimicrobiales bacterium]
MLITAAAACLMVGVVAVAAGVASASTPAGADPVAAASAAATLRLVRFDAAQAEAARLERIATASRDAEAAEAAAKAAAEQAAAQARSATPTRASATAPPPVTVEGSPLTHWPHRGRITGRYGERRRSHIHAGVDIDGSTGDAIRSAGPGTVVAVGRLADYGGYGLLVLVDHPSGVRTLYSHLSSVSVSAGQAVSGGEVVGGMGCTGSCTGSHLHFEVRIADRPQNPHSYLP